jgi:protein tyrosine phosphatase (PTP) superfamily phosphohydrolase (DUF442 family)
MIRKIRWLFAVALLGLFAGFNGCSRSDGTAAPAQATAPALPVEVAQPSPADPPRAVATLEKIEVGAATPVHQFGRYYLAGQPAEEDFATWKDKGVRTVISLRTPGEIDWDEKAAVEAQGMKFVSIPFRGADTLGNEQIESALAALGADEKEGILLHCGSSSRVGAIWYAHRIRHDGLTPEAAMEEAKTIGLRSTSLTDVVDVYCQSVGISE